MERGLYIWQSHRSFQWRRWRLVGNVDIHVSRRNERKHATFAMVRWRDTKKINKYCQARSECVWICLRWPTELQCLPLTHSHGSTLISGWVYYHKYSRRSNCQHIHRRNHKYVQLRIANASRHDDDMTCWRISLLRCGHFSLFNCVGSIRRQASISFIEASLIIFERTRANSVIGAYRTDLGSGTLLLASANEITNSYHLTKHLSWRLEIRYQSKVDIISVTWQRHIAFRIVS